MVKNEKELALAVKEVTEILNVINSPDKKESFLVYHKCSAEELKQLKDTAIVEKEAAVKYVDINLFIFRLFLCPLTRFLLFFFAIVILFCFLIFCRALGEAKRELSNLRNTIATLPVSFERYKEHEAERIAFLARQGLDWNQRGLPAQPVVGAFDNTAPIEKMAAASQKFITAEEEADQRKAELKQALTARKALSNAGGRFSVLRPIITHSQS